MSFPRQYRNRQMPDLRLGIKSSFYNIRNSIALLYCIYLASGKKAECVYSIPKDNVQQISNEIADWLNDYFNGKNTLDLVDKDEIIDLANNSNLITSQMEAIQVGLELVFGLAKVNFVDNSLANSIERTGKKRYQKKILFSSNILLLHSLINSFSEDIIKDFLFSWLKNKECYSNPLEEKICSFLTLQSERSVLKIGFPDKEDLIFQQEGIYSILMSENEVEIAGKENVGAFRVLYKFIAENMHTFLTIKDGTIQLREDKTIGDLQNYLSEISILLDLNETRVIKKNTFEPFIYTITNEMSQWNEELEPTILYGPPGTGKTHSLQEDYIDKFDKGLVKFTTFHQSFSYEEFVEGLKPELGNSGNDISYKIEKGVFYQACEMAAELAGFESLFSAVNSSKKERIEKFNNAIKEKKLVLLCIDEINRGNVASIFGDLISLIETSKRLGSNEELILTLPYSKEEFGVPSNLLIVGTMNTADRSIQLLDSALRRRFKFKELLPDYTVIKNNKAREILKSINSRVRALINKDSQIGHSFFYNIPQETEKESVLILKALVNNIIPLLEEYFYNDHTKVRFVLSEDDKIVSKFYIKDKSASEMYDKFATIADFDEKMDFYELNPDLKNALENEEKAKEFLTRWEKREE